ncbi:MAG: CDP-diacylglycerol--serine O-phosphatidyltransferase [Deltaproteobacteria bacterium]|jgi:CDP-diacylglycerol--serine O-phosphatidyltransferase|nr:CDP-diacylglycerol--serine O-phosphatidyltransferase [Deltaproteobacteria bacterium]
MSQKRKLRSQNRRAIYILPNLFTTLSLLFGFYSMICSIHGRFVSAAVAILLAAIMDALDGTVARMTHTTSQFGLEYDSLCDLVSFGVAPALLVYLWALRPNLLRLTHLVSPEEKTISLGVMVAFVFLACGALRLARFNVFAGFRDPGFFQGLPIPGGAGVIASTVLWHYRFAGSPITPNGYLILTLTVVTAFLMVSNLDYFSLKNRIIVKNNHPFETLTLIVIILAVAIIKVKTILFPLALFYLASGFIVTPIRYFRRRRSGEGRLSPEEGLETMENSGGMNEENPVERLPMANLATDYLYPNVDNPEVDALIKDTPKNGDPTSGQP